MKHQDTRITTVPTKRPFVASAPAGVFAQRGYMVEDSSGRTYYAPDADVLLDESFAAVHCFHLQEADDAHRGQIGLAFTPVDGPGRDTLVDVRGVIWIDRADPALRSLDFLYTGLEPAAMASRAGGQIEFHTMPNGVSFIGRWVLRLAVLDRPRMTPGESPWQQSHRRQSRTDFRTVEIYETGGEVLGAKWTDGTRWQATPAGIRGSVMLRGQAKPASFAVVSLLGTADSANADSSGRFSLASVVPGRYTLVAADSTLGSFAAPRVARQVVEVVRDHAIEVQLQVSPLMDVVRNQCDDKSATRNTTTLFGRIVFANGQRSRSAKLSANWQAEYNHGGSVAPGGDAPLSVKTDQRTLELDSDARFTLCHVAMDRPIRLNFNDGSRRADTTFYARDSGYVTLEWRLNLLPVTPH